jgi:D-alanyl-D-alanine carboxypeptidase/D-alanyl-D-alanine-endopeptidase (penicillin-binding protein 4)
VRGYFCCILILLLTSCAKPPHSLYDQKPAYYSYIVGDIKGNISTELNADVYATPASCQKVITALLAYKTLGSDFQYETKLYSSQKDIIIKFSGDPTLKSESLAQLLEPLQNQKIHGRIILDASLYKTPSHSTNIMIGDVGTAYAPPISAIILDGNVINVVANSEIPNDSGFKIKSPQEIDSYILHKTQLILKDKNIAGSMIIVRDEALLPTNLKLINSVKSEKLGVFLPPALKKSDNLVFDSLYLKIVDSGVSVPITDWTEGSDIVKSLIEKNLGIKLGNALIIDGSGLSRYNRIQPRQLFEILQRGYDMKEFVDALPFPGEPNSTLALQKKLPKAVKAKTGNVLGVSCLCGYRTNGSEPKVFVIMANSFAPPVIEIFSVFEQFLNKQLVD